MPEAQLKLGSSSHLPRRESRDLAAALATRNTAEFGKYRVIGRLGRGGMGVVYEAIDTVLDRRVALKLLPRSVSASSELLRRFQLEAKSVARLNHANVVTIFEADRQGEIHYLAMELVRGGSAQDYLDRRGAFSWPEAARIIADACRGLAAAHLAGIIHRDIKPGNLMRGADGSAKLADFGLARAVDQPGLTVSGAGSVLGTPHYMSPEQCRGETADERSDLYSLGATFFSLLTGRPPFSGEAALQVMYAHCSSPLPNASDINPTVPASCAAIVRRAMAKEPRDRYSNAGAMLADLESVIALPANSLPGIECDAFIADRSTTETIANPTLVTLFETARRRWKRYAIAAAVGLLLPLVVWMIGFRGRSSEQGTASRTVANREASPEAPVPSAEPRKANGSGVRTFECIWNWNAPSAIQSVAFSPKDGALAAACQAEWNATSLSQSSFTVWGTDRAKQFSKDETGRTNCVAFSPDGTLLAVGGASTQLWNVPNRETVQLIFQQPLDGEVVAAGFSGNGRYLAFAVKAWNLRDHRVLVCDVSQRRQFRDMRFDRSLVNALTFTADDRLALGCEDGTIRITNVRSNAPPKRLQAAGPVSAVSYSATSRLLAAGTRTRQIQTWQLDQLEVVPWTSDIQSGEISGLSYSPDGGMLAAASGSSARLWSMYVHLPVREMATHNGPVVTVAWSADGKSLATGGLDHSLKLWDMSRYLIRHNRDHERN